MNKFLQSIIGQVFPSISMRKANTQLNEKIKSTESQSNRAFMDNFDEIPIESFRQKYTEAFEVKNKFEDKAKTNVIGITIAITVIMGASGLTGSLISKYPSFILHWVSFAILLAAIFYLLVSGIDAIRVLFDENAMSTVDLPDLAADDVDTKEKYDDCTNRNINRNIIRNNIVYSSYICIRNALICMMVLFVLVSIPLTTAKSKDNKIVVSSGSSISYSSSIIIPDEIDIVDINNCVIQDREDRDSIEDGTTYSFVNINNNYYVQYKCFGSEIIVESFFCFDKVINE